jgi:hypothetical protein
MKARRKRRDSRMRRRIDEERGNGRDEKKSEHLYLPAYIILYGAITRETIGSRALPR